MCQLLQFPQALAAAWANRVLDRLREAENHEENSHFRDDLRQSQVTLALAMRGDAAPFVIASYRIFGCHADQGFEKLMARRRAKLGREYSVWFEDNGLLKPDVPIPDYDPTCALTPVMAGRPTQDWEPTRKKWPKAPLRLVMRRRRIVEGSILYYEEILECGHTRIDYFGGSGGKRRRCRDYQNALEMKHADVEQAGSMRGPEERKGSLYEMPAAPRSAQHQPLRILPA